MKYLKTVLLLIFITGGCLSQPLKLDAFIKNDDIYILLINNSEKSIHINRCFMLASIYDIGTLAFKITNDKNEEMPFMDKINFESPVNFGDLQPGNIIGLRFNLIDSLESYYLEPGTYTIQVVYKNKFKDKMPTYIGEVYSEPIQFKVEKPTGRRS